MLHGRDVRDGAAHPDEGVGSRAPIEARELRGDRGQRLVQDGRRHDGGQPEPLREPHGADRDAVLLGDVAVLAERELRAPAARVEDDEAPGGDAETGPTAW